MFPQVSDVGTPVVVHDWDFFEKDHLKVVSVPGAPIVENPSCKCCGSDDMRKITQVENVLGATSVESSWCPDCNFIQHTRGYAREWLHEHFRDHWLERRRIKKVNPSDNILKRVQDVLSPGSVVLDIGCGNGDKLIPFQQLGHDCYGVEPCSREVDLARQHFPADRIFHSSAEAFLEDPQVPQADLAYFSGVLAFIEDPFTVLKQVVDKLKPGGYLFLLEPNYTSNHWSVLFNSHMVICPSFFSAKCFETFAAQNDLGVQIRSNAPLGVLFRKSETIEGEQSWVDGTDVTPETIYSSIDSQVNFKGLHDRRLLKLNYHRFGMTTNVGIAREVPHEDRSVEEQFPIRFIHNTATPPVLLK